MTQTSFARPRTLFAKIWDAHAISEEPGQGTLLYIDRHMLNEVTTPQPFASLRVAGRRVRQPEATFGLVDHSIPTTPIGNYGRRSQVPVLEASRATQIAAMEHNAREFGVVYFGIDDPRSGIEHVSAPEQGITLPGMTMVCGDSHTSTHGAFGVIAFGIGTSEVEHVLASQCLHQSRPGTKMEVHVEGNSADWLYRQRPGSVYPWADWHECWYWFAVSNSPVRPSRPSQWRVV